MDNATQRTLLLKGWLLVIKTNCVMYTNVYGLPGCSGLSKMLCVAGGSCSFYKTEEDVREQMRKVITRKMALGMILNADDRKWANVLELNGQAG